MTKPSRSASQGREARSGSSFLVERARIEAKPAMASGQMTASLPPAIMASASPYWIRRKASPTAWRPVVQAVAGAELGPRAP